MATMNGIFDASKRHADSSAMSPQQEPGCACKTVGTDIWTRSYEHENVIPVAEQAGFETEDPCLMSEAGQAEADIESAAHSTQYLPLAYRYTAGGHASNTSWPMEHLGALNAHGVSNNQLNGSIPWVSRQMLPDGHHGFDASINRHMYQPLKAYNPIWSMGRPTLRWPTTPSHAWGIPQSQLLSAAASTLQATRQPPLSPVTPLSSPSPAPPRSDPSMFYPVNHPDQIPLSFETLIARDIEPAERKSGILYLFTRPSDPQFKKIGATSAPRLQRRLNEWKSKCHYVPIVHHSISHVPHVRRVEKLIHRDLIDFRRKEKWCRFNPRCKAIHGEWFEIDIDTAVKVMEKWTKWILSMKPYEMQVQVHDQNQQEQEQEHEHEDQNWEGYEGEGEGE